MPKDKSGKFHPNVQRANAADAAAVPPAAAPIAEGPMQTCPQCGCQFPAQAAPAEPLLNAGEMPEGSY